MLIKSQSVVQPEYQNKENAEFLNFISCLRANKNKADQYEEFNEVD